LAKKTAIIRVKAKPSNGMESVIDFDLEINP
jgi:hypothetical protein